MAMTACHVCLARCVTNYIGIRYPDEDNDMFNAFYPQIRDLEDIIVLIYWRHLMAAVWHAKTIFAWFYQYRRAKNVKSVGNVLSPAAVGVP